MRGYLLEYEAGAFHGADNDQPVTNLDVVEIAHWRQSVKIKAECCNKN
jgi:hypothetical protein